MAPREFFRQARVSREVPGDSVPPPQPDEEGSMLEDEAAVSAAAGDPGAPSVTTTPPDALPPVVLPFQVLERILAVIGQPVASGLSEEGLARILAENTQAVRKALKPENPVGPQISVFNPLGDRDHPRPILARRNAQGALKACEYFLGPYPLDPEVLTREEIELLNQVQAGEYRVRKTNGSMTKMTVRADLADGGDVRRVILRIPCADDDQRADWPPLADLLKQALGITPADELAALRAEVEQLRSRGATSPLHA